MVERSGPVNVKPGFPNRKAVSYYIIRGLGAKKWWFATKTVSLQLNRTAAQGLRIWDQNGINITLEGPLKELVTGVVREPVPTPEAPAPSVRGKGDGGAPSPTYQVPARLCQFKLAIKKTAMYHHRSMISPWFDFQRSSNPIFWTCCILLHPCSSFETIGQIPLFSWFWCLHPATKTSNNIPWGATPPCQAVGAPPAAPNRPRPRRPRRSRRRATRGWCPSWSGPPRRRASPAWRWWSRRAPGAIAGPRRRMGLGGVRGRVCWCWWVLEIDHIKGRKGEREREPCDILKW